MAKLIDREIIPRIMDKIDSPEILLLVGARQVGKTSAMHLIMNRLRERVNPQNIHFFDLEDFLMPLEIKYRSFQNPTISRSMRSFLQIYEPPYALVITKDFVDSKKYDNVLVYFIPSWLVG